MPTHAMPNLRLRPKPLHAARLGLAILAGALALTTAARAQQDRAAAPVAPITPPIAGFSGGATAPPRPAATLLMPGVPIPANGSIIVQTISPTFTAADVKLIDPAGNTPIDGTVRMVGQYAVWTPTRTLTPGVMYTVSIATAGSVFGAMQYQLMVAPVWTPARVAVTSNLKLERAANAGTTRCCTQVPGVSKGSVACFVAEQRNVARLTTELKSSATPTEVGQFLFRLSPTGMTPAVVGAYRPLVDLSSTAIDWPVAAAEYCVNLEALEITSGKTFEYPNLMPRCAAHGNLGELGIEEVQIDAAMVLGRERCPVPPPNYDMRWCEVNKAACGNDRSLIGCENYGHMCLGEPVPQPPAAGTVAKAGSGGALAAGSGAAGARATAGSTAMTGGTGAAGKTALPQPPAASGGAGGSSSDKPVMTSGGTGAMGNAGTGIATPPNGKIVRSGCAAVAASGSTTSSSLISVLLGVGYAFRRRRLRHSRVGSSSGSGVSCAGRSSSGT